MVISFILIDSLVLRIILALGFIIHNYVFLFRIKTREPEIKNVGLDEKTSESAL